MSDAVVIEDLMATVIDALPWHVCVVDPDGIIIAVNQAWKSFSANNASDRDIDYIGVNYLTICRNSVGLASDEAMDLAEGLQAVLRRQQERFQLDYPCHSSQRLRWFQAHIRPLRRTASGSEIIGAVVSHINITDQKLAEITCAKLADKDSLTGIPTRRFFSTFAKIEMERFHRFGTPLSLLIVDIDNFKDINAAYGNEAGDDVLGRVGSFGATFFQNGYLFARLGGEAFVCLLPGIDRFAAVAAAERLRAEIAHLVVFSGTQQISLTASVGVTSARCQDLTVDSVVLRADEALFRAKSDGRNCLRSIV